MKPNTDERQGWTSASNAEADELCRGRHLAQQLAPKDNESTKDAEFGTRIHRALAKQDPEGLELDEREVYDACTDIELDTVQRYFGTAENRVVVREVRFWIDFPPYRHSAKPDVVYRTGTKLLVFEYKTLMGDVPSSPENLQLRDQICAVWRNLLLVDRAACAPIQPWVTHHPELCEYGPEQIMVALQQLHERVTWCNDPKSPRTPGHVQCKFCRAKSICHEHLQWASEMVPGIAGFLNVPVADWSPEQRAIFCERESVARQWLDRCWDELVAGAQKDPHFIPGWKLKPGQERSSITNPQECFNRFASMGGGVAAFMRCVSIVKKNLRTQLAAVTKLKGKKLDATMDQLTAGITETKFTRETLEKE